MKAGIQRGMTVDEIARELQVSVVRVCFALEKFGMDFYQFRDPKTPFRKAG
ncbi:MAG: hypothetical protein MK089_06095 [Phycisphaerales bacterium]|nr:hypothetical protein [Phycisphaerales bacterium]